MNLYNLTDARYQLLQLEEELDQETFLETLESIEEAIDKKVVNIAYMVKNITATITAFKEEEKRLAERRRALESKVTRLKDYALSGMEINGLKKASDGITTISIRKGAPSLHINEVAAVPEEFLLQQEPKVDKRELLRAIKEGLAVDGVSLQQKESVTIK